MMKRVAFWIVTVAIVLVAAALGALNQQSVTLRYAVAEATMPLSHALLLVFALGFVSGSFWGLIPAWRAKRRLRKLQKQTITPLSTPTEGERLG